MVERKACGVAGQTLHQWSTNTYRLRAVEAAAWRHQLSNQLLNFIFLDIDIIDRVPNLPDLRKA
jgi:hypothetical protein